MMESIRCCISCILPCGALDVIRIVHVSGRVEEITGPVSAADIMLAYPKHVLRRPPSFHHHCDTSGGVPRSVILPPNAELQRGKIYFLVPLSSSSTPAPKKSSRQAAAAPPPQVRWRRKNSVVETVPEDRARLIVSSSDRYLSEIMSEKVRDRRRGRAGVWRPRLESISEVATNDP